MQRLAGHPSGLGAYLTRQVLLRVRWWRRGRQAVAARQKAPNGEESVGLRRLWEGGLRSVQSVLWSWGIILVTEEVGLILSLWAAASVLVLMVLALDSRVS